MHRMIEALERSKMEKASVLRETSRDGPTGKADRPAVSAVIGPAPAVSPPMPPPRTGPGEIRSITYSHTRCVAVDPIVLRAWRVMTETSGPAADAYKILCAQVLQRLRENGWNALAVVSPGYREGKTLTAINLAISLSREVGHTVALVDADLRQPSVHRYFGLSAQAGLSDHLLDGISLEKILINPGIPDLVVLPGGRPVHMSAELLGSSKMADLVQELKQRYPSRIIVFDLPPVLSAADALAFAPHVDAALMVAEEARTSSDDLLRAAEMLECTNLLGTVLNNARSVGHVPAHAGSEPVRKLHARAEPQLATAPADASIDHQRATPPARAALDQKWWKRLLRRRV